MKVWIIQKACEDIVGVYASEDLALKYLQMFRDDNPDYPHHYEFEEYEVKEDIQK